MKRPIAPTTTARLAASEHRRDNRSRRGNNKYDSHSALSSYTLNVTFALGTDPDIDTVNVQNRASLAIPQLPDEVQRSGLSVRKKSPPFCR